VIEDPDDAMVRVPMRSQPEPVPEQNKFVKLYIRCSNSARHYEPGYDLCVSMEICNQIGLPD
jgi:hypothetical protein